jgi:2-polyprenyl-6-methoxyphenol hydroxylase-like FAD-dependent oxidoreductase
VPADVAIVGYGPGGQALAALLSRLGHRVVAVERYPHLYNLPRAGHIDHEAMRLVQNVGDADALWETLWEVRDDYVWLNADGERLMAQPAHSPADAVSGWYSDFTMWQPHLERALDEAAVGADADVRLGRCATELVRHDDAVELVVGDNERIRARYCVGADGASSFVRSALGIEREDLGFNERWLDVDMQTLRPLAFEPNLVQICDPRRPRMLMPLGRDHRRFEWMLLPGEATADFERREVAYELLAEFGVTPETHEIARQVVYTFQARIAETWRVGRVLLLGDAAHTMPPFAGQGLLSSLRDANNLAWKLDLVLRGLAPEMLLDTYERERRPHVAGWTEISMAEGAVSCELDPERAAERDARLLAGEGVAASAPPELGPGVFADAPLARTLGMQGRVRLNGRAGRFDDVVGGRRFTIVSWGPSGLDNDPRLRALGAGVVDVSRADEDGRYRAYFDAHGVEAVVNRPDFYVFGAARTLDDLPTLVDDLISRIGGSID